MFFLSRIKMLIFYNKKGEKLCTRYKGSNLEDVVGD
jgi:hypothetical protein